MTHTIDKPVLALVGPTAVGKTSLSLDLAREFGCEIISVDSMQVYRHMDIGTAKVKPHEQQGIPHHLIDIVDPDAEYDAAQFVQDASEAMQQIETRGRLPLLAGGTGLYLKALTSGIFAGAPENKKIREEIKARCECEGSSKLHEELMLCDEESAKRIHPNDSSRIIRGLEIFQASGIPWSEHLRRQKAPESRIGENILQIGLKTDRQRLYERINFRTELMIQEGLEDEVRRLLTMGYSADLKSMGSIGYRHMLNYINGVWSFNEMIELLARDTRRYAKRQFTWFNHIPAIEWFDVSDFSGILARISSWLKCRA